MRRWLFAWLLLPTLLSAAPEQRIESIELSHRPAAELAPILQPLLRSDEALTAQGFTLILRASPETLEQIRAAIQKLDLPARNLFISVLRSRVQLTDAQRLEGAVSIRGPAGGVSIGAPTQEGVEVRAERRYSAGARDTVHSLRVLDGDRAFIDTGSAVPYPAAAVLGRGGVVGGGIEYKGLREGFLVLPRTRGDAVMLEIEPLSEQRAPGGAIRAENAATTLSARLGEWVLLGGVGRAASESGRSIVERHQTRTDEDLWIYVKVEPTP